MNKSRHLEKKGEVDYDYRNDVLFFKTKNREYSKSIEFDNFVIDIDKKDFIVGIQLFEASKFLNITKDKLMNVKNWKFSTKTENITKNEKKMTRIEIRLFFEVVFRNKIIEKNPILLPNYIGDPLQEGELSCVA